MLAETKKTEIPTAGRAASPAELEQALQERLRFETLLADLSVRFVNLPGEAVDSEINGALEHVVKFLSVDRSGIDQFDAEGQSLFRTHAFALLDVPPCESIDLAQHFPWYTAQIRAGGMLVYSHLPNGLCPEAEAEAERRYITQYGMKSQVCIPLQAGGKILGALGVAAFRAQRNWSPELVSRLQLLATIFASALARKRAEEKIIKEWEVTFNSIRDLVSFHDRDFRVTRVNKAFTDALGIEAKELIGKKCYEIIHGAGEPWLHCPHKQILESRKSVTEEFWEPRLGIYLQVSVSPILNDRNEVIGSVHIAKDITQRKRAEGALQKAHDELEKRVEERTAEMIGANKQLAQEIEDRKRAELDLKRAYVEIQQLKDQLQAENVYLREETRMEHNFDQIIGQSNALKYVLFRVEQVAPAGTTVLILGETGTGKGLVAHAIHDLSSRENRPMVTVNCAALPANLIESELFGREKGAFTGSHARQIGRFEVADGGTIFLDEIGEMPLELQAKLLRVIQDGEFERLGSPRTLKVNVRIIASTSRDLKEEIRKGRFREDLYYRLHVFPITLPPLRQRKEDISLLVNYFINRFAKKIGKEIKTIPKETMKALQTYDWPGNVRELENVIERAVITSQGTSPHLADHLEASKPALEQVRHRNLLDMEREHIFEVLKEAEWKIEGKNGAAAILGLNPSTLRGKMRKLGIKKDSKK